MNLTIPKKDLVRLLTRCQGVASKKALSSVLSSVLLTAKPGLLCVAATDTVLVLTDSAAAEVEKPGAVAAPAKDLLARATLMPDGPLKLSVDAKSGALTIKSGGASSRKFTIQTFAASDFPELPSADGVGVALEIEPADLARLIDLVKVSISPDETRPHLNSALFEWSAGRARMVSTNGRMLSIVDHALAIDGTASMLVPLRALTEVAKLAAVATSPITMRPVGPRLFFDVGSARFGVTLVDDQFPPYQQVVPKSSLGTITLEREALSGSLSASRLVLGPAKATRLTVSKGTLRITGESPTAGNVFEELAAEGWEHPAQDVGFDAEYVVNTLAAMTCSAVSIGLGGPEDPMLVRPDSDDTHLAVIMPMKLAAATGVARG